MDATAGRVVKSRIGSFRALCLTDNLQLRRALRRSLQGAGSVVEFAPVSRVLEDLSGNEPDLIVLDAHSRREVDLARLAVHRAQIIVIGESLEHEEVLSLLREKGLNHVFSDSFSGTGPAEDESLVITSGKVFQHDIFGLEKYLAWGALVHERLVPSYESKREALLEVAAYAGDVGARRQVVARVESVTDELLMNALYDAPAIRYGVAQRARAGEAPAVLRYACDGRYLGVSVRDGYGELRKDAILDHILRARAMRGAPQHTPSGGAGLGLYFVLTSVARFIANVAPGQLTEVIGLFDIKATGRAQEGCARSLHMFVSPRLDLDSVPGLTPGGSGE